MTDTLSRADLERAAERLRALYDSMSHELGRSEAEYFGTPEERLEHQADAADVHAEDVGIEIVQQEGATVRQIVRALARVESGGYGFCEGCDEPIPRARLEAIPYATRCVDCAAAAS